MRSEFLPYALPSIGEEEIAEVADSLRSGWVTTGPKVKRFEEEFARYTGAPHAIAVSSCTAALEAALAALDIGPGDEVVVPTLTFCATANVVAHLGAKPVIVDVDRHGLLAPEAFAAAVTERTRAVLPVHYAGQACDLDGILAVARRKGIAVVDDAAHAVGARYRGAAVGTRTRATAFSFYATKNMTTGEGGMLTTDDDRLAARLRRLALHGMSRDAWKRYTEAGSWYYEVLEPGYKFNMTDIQAALGLHQLRRLEGFLARRRELAARYLSGLAGLDDFMSLPVSLPERTHTWHLFPIVLRGGPSARARFVEHLKQRRIGASVHFIPLHRHPYYRDRHSLRAEDFPNAEQLYSGLVSLPLYPAMTDRDADDVIDAVQAAAALDEREPAAAPAA